MATYGASGYGTGFYGVATSTGVPTPPPVIPPGPGPSGMALGSVNYAWQAVYTGTAVMQPVYLGTVASAQSVYTGTIVTEEVF